MPSLVGLKVLSPIRRLNQDALVCDLIDPDSWKRDIVASWFYLFEAQEIINIPISGVSLKIKWFSIGKQLHPIRLDQPISPHG